jgi:hypothetical protein
MVAALLASSLVAPAALRSNANASGAEAAQPVFKGAERLLTAQGRVWKLPSLPQGTSGLSPYAVTAGGTSVVAGAIAVLNSAQLMLLDVPEAARICYVFNDRWPSGHPIRAKEGFAFGRIVFSADGKMFVAAMDRQRNRRADIEEALSCFSVADGRLDGTVAIDEPGFLRAVAFSPSGDYVMCAHAGGISIYSAPGLKQCYSLGRPNQEVAFSADGRYAALVEWVEKPARGSAVVEPKGQPTAEYGSPASPVGPKSRSAGSAGVGGSSQYTVPSSYPPPGVGGGGSQQKAGEPPYSPGGVGYSPGSTGSIGSAEGQQEISLVELRTKQVWWHVSADHDIHHPALSSDGGLLACEVSRGDSRSVEVWDARWGKRIARLDGLGPSFVHQFLPNSDILTVFDYRSGGVAFYSIPSCKRLGTIEHREVGRISFCGDGRSLAIGEGKNSIGLWDLERARLGQTGTRTKERASAKGEPSEVELSGWYDAIGGSDAKAARKGMEGFEGSGDRSVEFLETRLKPETVGEAELLALVRELDSDEFRVRQDAVKKLEPLARIAKGQLQKQMEASRSAEVRTSLRRVLAAADDYCIRDAECLRCLRAIECLEVIGSAGSRRLLTRLAGGSPSSPVTQDASAALVRMDGWVSGE